MRTHARRGRASSSLSRARARLRSSSRDRRAEKRSHPCAASKRAIAAVRIVATRAKIEFFFLFNFTNPQHSMTAIVAQRHRRKILLIVVFFLFCFQAVSRAPTLHRTCENVWSKLPSLRWLPLPRSDEVALFAYTRRYDCDSDLENRVLNDRARARVRISPFHAAVAATSQSPAAVLHARVRAYNFCALRIARARAQRNKRRWRGCARLSPLQICTSAARPRASSTRATKTRAHDIFCGNARLLLHGGRDVIMSRRRMARARYTRCESLEQSAHL